MQTIFRISIRFLQPLCHGRNDSGDPEWPPSPLRLFQALVSSASARWNEKVKIEYATTALRWLEKSAPPSINATNSVPSEVRYRLYVPDNVADKVAKSWSLGKKAASIADYRTEKDIRPSNLVDNAAVHYLFPIAANDTEFEKHRETLIATARSITHLGWGIDMVAADADIISEEEAKALPGERWEPAPAGEGAVTLRVPIEGTLNDLMKKHAAFLNRLVTGHHGNQSFNPVPPLSVFKVSAYRRTFDPAPQQCAVFSILQPDGSGYRAFDTASRATVVAGMVRHALTQLAKDQRPFGWSDADIDAIITGHASGQQGRLVRDNPDEPRFAYLPLPSIERRGERGNHVGMIRRVMVAGRPGMSREMAWVRRALSGAELVEEQTGEIKGLLSLIPSSDWVARQYCDRSSAWTTVTPVVIPGFDDHAEKKTGKLLRKALKQAGFSEELLQHAELDWRGVGFLPGLDLASQYRRPVNIREAPVCHVTIRWRDSQGQAISIPGPIAIGSGRFRGLGLFTILKEEHG